MTVRAHCIKLFAIEVVGLCTALAKEQPITAFRTECASFVQECSKGVMPVPGPIMMIGASA